MAVLKNTLRRTIKLMERYPLIVPLFAFASGVASFFLVQRKQEEFSQILSILMLGGWIWLASEDLLQRGISHWFNIEVPPGILRYFTQLIHQESLFFVVPLFFFTTAWNSGQSVFTVLLIISAFVSIIDPLYYHWLAPRRWLYFIFHGVTLFCVLLTALPLIFHLQTSKSYLLALIISVLLSLPGITRSITASWWRRIALSILLMPIFCGIGYFARPWIPAASIWLTQVAITERMDSSTIDQQSHDPNALANFSSKDALKIVTNEQLRAGIYAYTAIHAPRGLNERIYHQWRFNGKDMDKIPLTIVGGREQGYKSWSHKMNFPVDSIGHWQIYVVTEGRQVIGVLRFEVVNSLTQTQSQPKSQATPVSEKQEAPANNTEPTPASTNDNETELKASEAKPVETHIEETQPSEPAQISEPVTP